MEKKKKKEESIFIYGLVQWEILVKLGSSFYVKICPRPPPLEKYQFHIFTCLEAPIRTDKSSVLLRDFPRT